MTCLKKSHDLVLRKPKLLIKSGIRYRKNFKIIQTRKDLTQSTHPKDIPAQSLLWWLLYFLPTYLRPDKAEAVSGRDCVKIREKILKDYETGSINVLCACDLLNEGLDSPH